MAKMPPVRVPVDVSQINAVQVALKKTLAEVKEANREAHELLKGMHAAKIEAAAEMVTLMKVLEKTKNDVRADFEKFAKTEIEDMGKAVAFAIETAQIKIATQFEELAQIYFEDNGIENNLFDRMRQQAKLRKFAGDPISAAAEPLKAGQVIVVKGIDYEIGMDARFGDFLYQNSLDKKLYPGPKIQGFTQ